MEGDEGAGDRADAQVAGGEEDGAVFIDTELRALLEGEGGAALGFQLHQRAGDVVVLGGREALCAEQRFGRSGVGQYGGGEQGEGEEGFHSV
ncbi:MAG: hypothetical protein EON60_11345 [Alphaproteobacteria bacterium]|nr:MAG: hypothetical protein EON60_11345 [Alphaproteobacteria bacterium]